MKKKFKKRIENASESYIFRERHRSYSYTYIFFFILMSLEPEDISVDESLSSVPSDLYIYTWFDMSAPKNMHAEAQTK